MNAPRGTHSADARRRGPGRPRGARTSPPLLLPHNNILITPGDGATALVLKSIMAATHTLGWEVDDFGYPAYRPSRGNVSGTVAFLPPGHENIATGGMAQTGIASSTEEMRKLGAADLQLLMCVSNLWMCSSQPADGVELGYLGYAAVRGQGPAARRKSIEHRTKFNDAVHRLASLDVNVAIARMGREGRRRSAEVRGRVLLAEAVASVSELSHDGCFGERRRDVTLWRLVPGRAWLASRALHQIGRFPASLLTFNPARDDLLIRLGCYLGVQTAIRAANGTLGQALTIASILDGIGEAWPRDSRARYKLALRLESALDALAERQIVSWRWKSEPANFGGAFPGGSVAFAYHQGCILEHAQHHPRARQSVASDAVQRLFPGDSPLKVHSVAKSPPRVMEIPAAGDGNPPHR